MVNSLPRVLFVSHACYLLALPSLVVLAIGPNLVRSQTITAPASAPERPRLWAVIAAVDELPDARLTGRVDAMVRARALRRWLVEQAGWPASNILTLDRASQKQHGSASQDISSLYASRANLNWAVSDWLKARARTNDVVLVAWFGPAVTLPDDPEHPDAPARTLLLPLDARADDLAGSGWDLADALDPIAATGRNPILGWVDTAGSDSGLRERDAWLATIARWPSLAAWHATGADRFLSETLDALGTTESPRTVLGALDALRSKATGDFSLRTSGGIPSDLTLWASRMAPLGSAPPEIALLRGHSDRVLDLAATADGTRWFTASADSTVKVWKEGDTLPERTLADHTIGATRVALSPDGGFLASADAQGRVIVRALPALGVLTPSSARPHEGPVVALAFRDDGRRLVGLDATGRLIEWALADGKATHAVLSENASAFALGRGGRLAMAVSEKPGQVALVVRGRDGRDLASIPGPGGAIASGGLALGGDFLAASDVEGHLNLYSIDPDGKLAVPRSFELGEGPSGLRIVENHVLAAAGPHLHRIDLGHLDRPPLVLDAPGPIAALTATPDGTSIAVATEDGQVMAWRQDVKTRTFEPVTLETGGPMQATCVAFAPGSGSLVAGLQTGGLASWSWPSGQARRDAPSSRGQLRAIAATQDGRRLVLVTRDGQALRWDLENARALDRVIGRFAGVALLPGSRSIALTEISTGDVVMVDDETLSRRAVQFERPMVPGTSRPSRAGFRLVAASPDGKLVAAAATETNLAAVWEAGSGRLVHAFRDHAEGVSALAFSSDSRSVMTAGPDGSAVVRDLGKSADAAPIRRVDTGEVPITAAALGPSGPNQIITGHADGRVLRWSPGRDAPDRLDQLDGVVMALLTLRDPQGRTWLAAGGDDKLVRLVPLGAEGAGAGGAIDRPARLLPRHDERITAMASWAGGHVFSSASEDGTVRIWRLEDRSLLGTLAAEPDGGWVAWAPDGFFDASPGSESRVSWLRDNRVFPLDQFYERFRAFGLADRLRQGLGPAARFAYRFEAPPAIAMGPLPATTARREASLAVTLADPLAAATLYLDGVPVRGPEDFATPDPAAPSRRVVNVPLRRGRHVVHVMTAPSRPDGLSGRSSSLHIRCDAPERDGRLHVLALGVDAYPGRPLKFSSRDAAALARVLEHGIDTGGDGNDEASRAARLGRIAVLANGQVTTDAVRDVGAWMPTEARPEDAVVVFIAGHTAVRPDAAGRDRFCLLLPAFPFPPSPSSEVVTGSTLLAMRGGPLPRDKPDDPATILPYASIYPYLVRFAATQRVVILDACQAEAALDDPGVRRMERNVADKVDDAAHRVRVSYLLASRRDAPAFESAKLGHGLLTHLILRGLGAPDVAPEPNGPTLPNADADADGLVTTVELRQFVDQHLPDLAARVAPEALRAGPGLNAAGTPAQAAPVAVRGADDASFPLARLPAR
jgi:WD40 repeat protein